LPATPILLVLDILLLGVLLSWSRSLLVWLPEVVESWRERNVQSSSWSRLAR
jgi:hypothetical protein